VAYKAWRAHRRPTMVLVHINMRRPSRYRLFQPMIETPTSDGAYKLKSRFLFYNTLVACPLCVACRSWLDAEETNLRHGCAYPIVDVRCVPSSSINMRLRQKCSHGVYMLIFPHRTSQEALAFGSSHAYLRPCPSMKS
jgi:hypothetical protein